MSKSWVGTQLQALAPCFQNSAIGVFVIGLAVIVSYLGTGVLWPAAAILSSILTASVQGHLNKQSQDNCQQTAISEDQQEDMDNSRDAKLDEHALGNIAAQRHNIGEGSTNEDVTIATTNDAQTNPDRVDVSLTRSEGEDWGFAWDVGAHAAKRLILVSINTSSPMELGNNSRQANGLPMIAVGDELVCIDSNSDFDALQRALDSATSAQFSFLRAHAVPAITRNRRKQKKRLSMEGKLEVSAMEKCPNSSNEMRELIQQVQCAYKLTHEGSKVAIDEVMPSADSFEMVMKTKNTFIDFSMAESDSVDRLAKTDPTAMRIMYPILTKMMSSIEDVNNLQTEAVAKNEEISPSPSDAMHYDTMDIHDFVIGGLSIDTQEHEPSSSEPTQDSFDNNFGIGEHPTTPSEFSHHYDTMDLHDFFKDERTLCEDVAKEKQTSSEPCYVEAMQEARPSHLDGVGPYDVLPASQCRGFKNSISLVDLLSDEPIRVENSLYEPPHEFSKDGIQEKGYVNNIASEVLGMRPCLATPWKVPSTEIRGASQQQTVGSVAIPSHQKASEASLAQASYGSGLYLPIRAEPAVLNHKHSACSPSSDSDESTVASSSDTFDAKRAAVRPRPNFMKVGEDWYCPTCFDLQFRANEWCRMCGLPREHGVTDLKDLDADKFLQGHCVTAYAELKFRNLTPELQQAVMSGGSLHGARDPTAVLSKRIKKAGELAARRNNAPQGNAALSQMSAPVRLGFDKKRRPGSMRQHPAGSHTH